MHTRTRFAPSPTGFMHVGNLRTGLFAYLSAKHAGGTFILRIEDTDQNREVAGSTEHILRCLDMLGITPDEGLHQGGSFGPYKQSARLDVYQKWARKLIEQGRAYADPYSKDELDAFREQAKANKRAFLYRHHRPENPPEWDGSMPLRFKSEPRDYAWHDEVYGDLNSGPEVIDDFILIKSDGYPTYNFAHIIDDQEMQITHIIRGQEFLSSMPGYLNLYDALEIQRPIFAHMPHIMNEQGNKKLGKRDGAKDVLDYIADGYLPETLLSFIATLGWNDGTEQEVFTKKELIEKFTLERVQTSGARFDEKRLLWMNGQFIRDLPLEELEKRVEQFWSKTTVDATPELRVKVLALAQARLKTLTDLSVLTDYFFREPKPDLDLITGNKQLKKLSGMTLVSLLSASLEKFESLESWHADAIQATLNELLTELDTKPGVLFSLIRTVTTWAPFSPELDATLELLGKSTTLSRLSASVYLLR